MIAFIFSAMLFGLIFGLVVIAISTKSKKGKMGINTATVLCPKCGEKMPAVRAPRNLSQALWGGGTCLSCGCEMDKWGKETGRKSA
jgi:hypothetical protein